MTNALCKYAREMEGSKKERDPTNEFETELSKFIVNDIAIITGYYKPINNREVQIQGQKMVEQDKTCTILVGGTR